MIGVYECTICGILADQQYLIPTEQFLKQDMSVKETRAACQYSLTGKEDKRNGFVFKKIPSDGLNTDGMPGKWKL
ncbi:hypothetical protein ABH14_20195 [Brevibacillus brevis]|nr:hypothetical protein [Brevibacillus brevis]